MLEWLLQEALPYKTSRAHQSYSRYATFSSRTYGHLFAAILAVVIIEVILFYNGVAQVLARKILG